jgi:hypothetical protein
LLSCRVISSTSKCLDENYEEKKYNVAILHGCY